MQLLCGTGFTLKQRLESRQIIFNSIILAFQGVFEARREWGVDYESEILLVIIDFSDSLLKISDYLVAS